MPQSHYIKNSGNRFNMIYFASCPSARSAEIWFAHQGGEPSADVVAWRADVIKTDTVVWHYTIYMHTYKRTDQVFGRSVISMGMSKYFSISW